MFARLALPQTPPSEVVRWFETRWDSSLLTRFFQVGDGARLLVQVFDSPSLGRSLSVAVNDLESSRFNLCRGDIVETVIRTNAVQRSGIQRCVEESFRVSSARHPSECPLRKRRVVSVNFRMEANMKWKPNMKRALSLMALLLLAPTMLFAQAEVCNLTAQPVSVAAAVHVRDAPTFAENGWLTIAPYRTAVLVQTRLDFATTDYFVSIVRPNRVEVPGPISLCAPASRFNLPNVRWGVPCGPPFAAHSFNRLEDKGFFEHIPIGAEDAMNRCTWQITNPATHRVEGYVYSEGGPTPDQSVTLRRVSPPAAAAPVRTGVDGKFAFANLQAGVYTVSADSPDYSSQPVQVTIQVGRDTKEVAIKVDKKK